MYDENGRWGMSARYWKEIAEICEADGNVVDASAAYDKAAHMFDLVRRSSDSFSIE